MNIRTIAAAVLMAATLVHSPSQAAGPVRTFATFQPVLPKKGAVPRSLLYLNQDVIKTTTTTTRTPVYAPVYDKKGKVIGQKIVSYITTTTKATNITPKARLYTTLGITTTAGASDATFRYLAQTQAPFRSLPATIPALLTIDATANTAPTQIVPGSYMQAFSGTISLRMATPFVLLGGHGQPLGAPRSNLIRVQFTNASLVASLNATAFGLSGTTPQTQLTMTSDFLNFANATAEDFSLAATGASARIAIAAVDPTLTNVTGSRSFVTTRAVVSGQFSANSVPEPETWTVLTLGFGLIGGAARRQRRAPIAA